MRKLFLRILICTLVLSLAAGQAAAFDLQIGPLSFNSPAAVNTGPRIHGDNGFGVRMTIPMGVPKSVRPATTLNGRDISHFTQQDAKDSLIVIMLFGVAIGAAVLTASVAAD